MRRELPSGRNPLAYLLRDVFTTTAGAPLTSPRTAEPGPGTLTLVQTDGQFSISGGALNVPAQASFAWGDQAVYVPSVARIAGRALIADVNLTASNLWQFGYFSSLGGVSTECYTNYSNAIRIGAPDLVVWNNPPLSTPLKFGVVLRSAGAFYLGWASNVWTLLYVTRVNNTATFNAGLNNGSAAGTLDNLIIADTALNDASFQTAFTASPATGATLTSDADALIDFTWTAATGETLELMTRRVDDNNCWIVRCAQGGGTIKLIEKVAGAEMERGTATQTWTNGTAYRIVVIQDGATITGIVATNGSNNDTQKWSYTSALTNATATGVKISGFATGANLTAWRRYPVLPFSGTAAPIGILPVGDSKTYGTGDTIADGTTGYPPLLTASLSGYAEAPLRSAHGGFTVAMMRPQIVIDLADARQVPAYILINLGTNDFASGNATIPEATWKADYNAILDWLHAKWPSARIGLMRPWRATDNGQLNTVDDAWIPDLVAARAYCFLGPDERVFLKGADNGLTYTTDGVHPNHAGYMLTAAQWETAMGM
jgi:lysophospholipase L1-like esterase